MAASKLQGFIDKYGPAAGPKLYHALQSRAAYIGANARRRRTIAGLTGTPPPTRTGAHRPISAGPVGLTGLGDPTPILDPIEATSGGDVEEPGR